MSATSDDCIFCTIVAGEIPADVLGRTEHAIAFRDLHPQAPFHALVVPLDHHENVAASAAADPAVIGNAAVVQRLADELPLAGGPDVAVKMLPVIVFLANALLKFVWAHRLFGYCSILMAAVPNDPEDPLAFHRAGQAAEINITAAKSFNRGLRSIYYALAALGWLLGPWGLLAGALLATGILLRREFASHSRQVILAREP